MSSFGRADEVAIGHLDAVDAATSRTDALRYMLALFPDGTEDRMMLRALRVGGEERGVTFGDVAALLDVADDAREIVSRDVIDGVSYCPACSYHSSPESECGCGYGRIRDVLARLDATEGALMTAVLDQTAQSLARCLGNAIASDGDPHACQVWDSALVDAVDAARAHGLPLASVVCALQREAAERGWL